MKICRCEDNVYGAAEPFSLCDRSWTLPHFAGGSPCLSGDGGFSSAIHFQPYIFRHTFSTYIFSFSMRLNNCPTFSFANALLDTQKNSTRAVITERPIPSTRTRKAPATLSTWRVFYQISKSCFPRREVLKSFWQY